MARADTNQLAISRELNDLRRRVSRLERRQAHPRYAHVGDPKAATIASGEITITHTTSYAVIDTEGAAASDNLDTITGGSRGQLLFCRAADAAHTVVFTEAGNMGLESAGNFSLDNTQDYIMLIKAGTGAAGVWREISRSDNGA